ncbi:MAG: hypothetical protein CSA96_09950 [Bacteroidetes bacterium]|nr:MAG: hypothetical protein CSA96_09950 [Bacteroidota bacterium]
MTLSTLQRAGIALATLLIIGACQEPKNPQASKGSIDKLRPTLSLPEAEKLAALPLACMQNEYPNKTGQTLSSAAEIGSPKSMHPAFYGCFDWHSAVHAHWSLVTLLRIYPSLRQEAEIRQKLAENLSAENIAAELAYFERPGEYAYERSYGWAWLLKLAESLHQWDDPLARELENNLRPLTSFISSRLEDFLNKLVYPIRVGEHTNTAFALCFAWDYAQCTGRQSLLGLIEEKSRAFYLADKGCPLSWEPGGFDFLSPCLEEIDLMCRVLSRDEFRTWMDAFAPGLKQQNFSMETGKVGDRSDGKLVHLDGLNFSRAWVIYGLARKYPEYEHLLPLADAHMAHSLPELFDDAYEGGHWLGSFAIYALLESGLGRPVN